MGAFANIGTFPYISCKSLQIIDQSIILQFYNVFTILYNNRILVANIWNFSTYILEIVANNRILSNLKSWLSKAINSLFQTNLGILGRRPAIL